LPQLVKPVNELSLEEHIEIIKTRRAQARTDLYYLATEVLGYRDIRPEVHLPVMRHLAGFRHCQGKDIITPDEFRYHPASKDPVDVMGTTNRRMLLDPRGWFKSTINVIAHSVQLILNFPDISIHVVHAQTTIAEEWVEKIKNHFIWNERMRYLFPEFCFPMESTKRSRRDRFVSPARKDFNVSAPTVSCSSIVSTTAGMHFHWMKFSDIVEFQNSRTPEQMQKVVDTYYQYENLLLSPKYFIDIEGTCYHFGDLYNRIIEQELDKEPENRRYSIFIRGCFQKETFGNPETFSVEERDLPEKLVDEKRVSRFPQRFPRENYEQMELEDPLTFACQQLNNPVAAKKDDIPFPIEKMRWIPASALKQVEFQYFEMTVDTAEKLTQRSDFTAIMVCGVDRKGHLYVVDAVYGKFLPEKTVEYMFFMYEKWNCLRVKMEESSFNRGLEPTIRRRMALSKKYISFEWIKRDTNEAKVQRILAMQPWFHAGSLLFSDGLHEHVKRELKQEFSQFPLGRHDDLIDALADQFQGRRDFGFIAERKSVAEIMEKARQQMFEREEFSNLVFPKDTPQESAWGNIGML